MGMSAPPSSDRSEGEGATQGAPPSAPPLPALRSRRKSPAPDVTLRALVIDDDAGFRNGLAEALRLEGFVTATAESLAEARRRLAESPPHVVLVDLSLPDGSGLDLLKEIEPNGSSPEVILVTGQATVGTAVEALRLGATDYLTKPVDFTRVKSILANLARTRELKEEIGSLRGELRRLGRFGPLVGASAPMQQLYDLLSRIAEIDATVLVLGETGTGKGLVAQTIHDLSRRSRGAFVSVNCGAASPTLIESEMFGHERGSFTGADRAHRGYFERANRGTIFLDEITEMPLELQVKLLRVLETGTLTRVGGSELVKTDMRVIAASNQRPEEAVAAGKLREDLLYRLNVFPIVLAPLRERREDIELLADHFLDVLNRDAGTGKRLTPAALERLRAHAWPGNVRELWNVLQRAYLLAEDDIGVDVLPLVAAEDVPSSGLNLEVGTSIAEAERRLIVATVAHYDGNKKKASEVLKISLKTLYNRLNVYKGAGGSIPS
jgi:two-component system, NtrC family, response regulator HydG